MEVIEIHGVPIYELKCTECQSIIRYKASEVSLCHITCPVCGISNWANTTYPVEVKMPEAYYYSDDKVYYRDYEITKCKQEEKINDD